MSQRRYQQSKASKIIITGIRHFECFLDTNGSYVAGKSTIIIRGDKLLELLPILNSKLISFYISQSYSSLGIDGGINFSKDLVSDLPIVNLSLFDCSLLSKITKRIISMKQDDIGADTSDLEQQIDQMVYKLYDLTPEEIAIIEGESNA